MSDILIGVDEWLIFADKFFYNFCSQVKNWQMENDNGIYLKKTRINII